MLIDLFNLDGAEVAEQLTVNSEVNAKWICSKRLKVLDVSWLSCLARLCNIMSYLGTVPLH